MQPQNYVPQTNFQAEETAAVAGRSTVRTSALDAELQAVSLTLSQILTNLALIQRDDTQLKDLVVTTASLSANVKALFAGGINPRGAWVTATAYAVKDVVETLVPLISYVCVVAHTSGTFATDRTAGKWMVLGSEPGVGTLTSLTLTTGGITLGTNNTQDLAATANRFRSGYFGTTVFAGTSVVTPVVSSGGTGALQVGNTNGTWAITAGAGGTLLPPNDNTEAFGSPTKRLLSVFTPIIDSGTTGSLSLKTNNGAQQFRIDHTATAVNNLAVTGSASGAGTTSIYAVGSDTNITVQYGSQGNAAHNFFTSWGSALLQFQVLHTASATRNITVTGSNGGNPTIGVTAGSLAITPAVVMAAGLTVGGLTDISGANAGQVKFPAVQNASADANTLDDYEEGTWTLSVGGSATYFGQAGTYVKVGSHVYFRGLLSINAIGTGSTTVISGLPFSAAGETVVLVGNTGVIATNVVSIEGRIAAGGSSITLLSRTVASAAPTANAILQNSATLTISGCFAV